MNGMWIFKPWKMSGAIGNFKTSQPWMTRAELT